MFSAVSDEMSTVECRLEVEADRLVHAGEYLRAVLHIVSSQEAHLMLATIQLTGELTTADKYISPGPTLLELLARPPDYGGGNLSGTGRQAEATGVHKVFPVVSMPLSVVAAAERLHEFVEYSCILIGRLP